MKADLFSFQTSQDKKAISWQDILKSQGTADKVSGLLLTQDSELQVTDLQSRPVSCQSKCCCNTEHKHPGTVRNPDSGNLSGLQPSWLNLMRIWPQLVPPRIFHQPTFSEHLLSASDMPQEMATHSSITAWKIPRTEECGGLQFIGSQRAGHKWASEWCVINTIRIDERQNISKTWALGSVQLLSCPTLCNSMDCSMPGLPVHHQLLEPTQTHVHWVGDAIQPSHPLSSSCLHSFPASRSFPRSQFFTSGGQSIGVSTSALLLLMNIQDWFPLGWTGWISLQSKELWRGFFNTRVQKHQFSFLCQSNSHNHTLLLEKPQLWLDGPLLAK